MESTQHASSQVQIKLAPKPKLIFSKKSGKTVCFAPNLKEAIYEPIQRFIWLVNDNENGEPERLMLNVENCQDKFVEDFGKEKIKRMFNVHREVDDIIINELHALENVALAECKLSMKNDLDGTAWYVLVNEDGDWKIYQPESFTPIAPQRLVGIFKVFNLPKTDVDPILDAMCAE